jgi:hypothetical protein
MNYNVHFINPIYILKTFTKGFALGMEIIHPDGMGVISSESEGNMYH